MEETSFLAKTFLGLEAVFAKELVAIGANNVQIARRAVSFTGDKALLYRANLSCRTALRILMPILTFRANNADEVYENVKKVNWEKYLNVKKTFSVDATVHSETFTHSKFVAYRVKDAIADFFMEKQGSRPSVRIDNPDLFLNIHISHNDCTLSLDSSGESLHRRGYRKEQTDAPLNEVLAAGMLLLSGWNGQCDFVDPMCGSGTLLIEAALIALNIPPCIYRRQFAFEKWNDFDRDLFDEVYNDDTQERDFNFKIKGSDISSGALKICRENIESAGLSKYIDVEHAPISEFKPYKRKALMVTNPPYGERLKLSDLDALYSELGSLLKHKFTGNDAWVISSQATCLSRIGLRPSGKIKLKNGDLNCEFWHFETFEGKRNSFVAERRKNRKY